MIDPRVPIFGWISATRDHRRALEIFERQEQGSAAQQEAFQKTWGPFNRSMTAFSWTTAVSSRIYYCCHLDWTVGAWRMTLTIDRSKWLRGEASHMMTGDGCGCIIGHYLIAKGVPLEIIQFRYGFVAALEPFAGEFPELGEFVDDEGQPYFSPTLECDYLIGVNDGDPRSIHDHFVEPVNNDAQREAVLIRLMAVIGCELKFIGVSGTEGGTKE